MKTILATVALAALAGTASAGMAPNLLGNAGFEVAEPADAPTAGNWARFFGGAEFQQVQRVDQPFEGAFSLQIGTFNTANTFAGVTQEVAVQGDLDTTFSFMARSVVDNGALFEYRIEWKDAGGGFIGNQFGLTQLLNLGTDWEMFSLTAAAPTNAASAVAVIATQTFGGSAPHEGFAQFDNASLTQVPAPAGVAVLGLAGFAARRRRA